MFRSFLTASMTSLNFQVEFALVLSGGITPAAATSVEAVVLLRLGVACFVGVPIASVVVDFASIKGADSSSAVVLDTNAAANTQGGSCGVLNVSQNTTRNPYSVTPSTADVIVSMHILACAQSSIDPTLVIITRSVEALRVSVCCIQYTRSLSWLNPSIAPLSNLTDGIFASIHFYCEF